MATSRKTRRGTRADRLLERAISLIRKVERDYEVDFGISYVQIGSKQEASYMFWSSGGVIFLGDDLKGRQFKEFLFHELGHALSTEYDLSDFKRHFTKRKSHGPQGNYNMDTERFRRRPRVEGFSSGYAQIDWEEDFAETFSCYLVNGGKLRGKVLYGNEEISLADDPKLRKKLLVIRETLEFCRVVEKVHLETAI